MIVQKEFSVTTQGQGLYLITDKVIEALSGDFPEKGLLNLFIQHTSASLILQENADPSARKDLEEFFDRLVPEGQSWHSHTLEGPDDTVSHMKSSLTSTSLTVPIHDSALALGTWQGIYLWEHRKSTHQRYILLTVFS